jgi:hypothetical protein
LRTAITDEQRQEFGSLVEGTIRRIDFADFLCTVASALPKILAAVVRMWEFVLENSKL